MPVHDTAPGSPRGQPAIPRTRPGNHGGTRTAPFASFSPMVRVCPDRCTSGPRRNCIRCMELSIERAPDPQRTAIPCRRDTSRAPSMGRDLQARGSKARVQPAVAAGRRPRTQPSPCGVAPAAGFPPASLFRILARSRKRPRGSCARRPRPAARAAPPALPDRDKGRSAGSDRARRPCPRAPLDHHRVRTTARRPGTGSGRRPPGRQTSAPSRHHRRVPRGAMAFT